MIVMGLKQIGCPLVSHLREGWLDFNPSQPDDPDGFLWYPSGNTNLIKPDGN